MATKRSDGASGKRKRRDGDSSSMKIKAHRKNSAAGNNKISKIIRYDIVSSRRRRRGGKEKSAKIKA